MCTWPTGTIRTGIPVTIFLNNWHCYTDAILSHKAETLNVSWFLSHVYSITTFPLTYVLCKWLYDKLSAHTMKAVRVVNQLLQVSTVNLFPLRLYRVNTGYPFLSPYLSISLWTIVNIYFILKIINIPYAFHKYGSHDSITKCIFKARWHQSPNAQVLALKRQAIV